MTEPLRLTSRDGAVLEARRLRRGDGPALQAFNAALTAESRHKFLPHRYDDATIARVLDRSEAGEDLVYGLFDGPRLAGYFFLWYFRNRVPLLGIGLLDAYHGRGLGRQMMDILIDAAKTNGNEGIERTTMRGNHNAFVLYQKVGFRFLRNVENVNGDGTVVIELAMFCEIRPGARPMTGPHRPPV